MDESEFITAIYKQGRAQKLIKILDEITVHSADVLKLNCFSLKRFVAHLQKNPKKVNLLR